MSQMTQTTGYDKTQAEAVEALRQSDYLQELLQRALGWMPTKSVLFQEIDEVLAKAKAR